MTKIFLYVLLGSLFAEGLSQYVGCSQRRDSGPCYGNFRRFYFDISKNKCKQFFYGGCLGNKNRFHTLAQCLRACKARKPLPITPLDRCAMKKDQGPCYALYPRYYFDKTTKQCRFFFYGGCKGNRNNFRTTKSCLKACHTKTVSKPTGKKVLPARCLLKVDKGPCEGAFRRYYYNARDKRCKPFLFGGCGGNNNRFYTINSCNKMCQRLPNKTNRPDLCKLKALPGPCRAYFVRYYYDHKLSMCKQFVFGGCLGNSNNFRTLKECKIRCQK